MERKSLKKISLFLATLGVLLLGLAGCQHLFGGFAPPAPADLSATDGDFPDRVRLIWSPVPAAGAYEVFRATAAAGEYKFLARTAYPSYDDTAVVPGTLYWYKVRACNRAGCSGFTPAKSGRARKAEVPPVPTGLTASQGTLTNLVRLSWQAAAGATRYEVYRGPSQEGPYGRLASVNATSYDDTAVEPGVVYWYRVRACGGAGCSDLSAPVSGYAAHAGLPAPQNVRATDGTEPGKVVITWDAVPEATHYLVYRALAEAGDYTLLATVPKTSYVDTQVEAGKTYWYRVRACNPQGCGPLSKPDAGSPGEEEKPPDPPAPQG